MYIIKNKKINKNKYLQPMSNSVLASKPTLNRHLTDITANLTDMSAAKHTPYCADVWQCV
jgi:hypothetical protein